MSDKKTVEQLETELQESQQALVASQAINEELKKEIERLLNTEDKEEKKTGVGEEFTFEKVKYKLMISAIRIPGLGKRTALEIVSDKKAQEWLVKNKSEAIKKLA